MRRFAAPSSCRSALARDPCKAFRSFVGARLRAMGRRHESAVAAPPVGARLARDYAEAVNRPLARPLSCEPLPRPAVSRKPGATSSVAFTLYSRLLCVLRLTSNAPSRASALLQGCVSGRLTAAPGRAQGALLQRQGVRGCRGAGSVRPRPASRARFRPRPRRPRGGRWRRAGRRRWRSRVPGWPGGSRHAGCAPAG